MRRLARIVVPLMCLACGREPAAPDGVGAPNLAIEQVPTGGYDIYVYDVESGSSTQATFIAGAGEFNPSFSNNGKSIVYDVVLSNPYSQSLYVTDLTTGVSTPLAGGDGGNDGDWSPSGRFIAFDRNASVFMVPANGGTSTLVRANASDPQWGLEGRFLVVVDASDFSIRTIDLGSGGEHVVAPFGFNPAWSEDGTRIAFTDGNNIFFVPVDQHGAAVGAPEQLTFDAPSTYNQQPSWSRDGKSIVFHSSRGNDVFDFDIWVVRVSGGAPTRMTGTVGTGDFDPAYFGKHLVAFGGFTPPSP